MDTDTLFRYVSYVLAFHPVGTNIADDNMVKTYELTSEAHLLTLRIYMIERRLEKGIKITASDRVLMDDARKTSSQISDATIRALLIKKTDALANL